MLHHLLASSAWLRLCPLPSSGTNRRQQAATSSTSRSAISPGSTEQRRSLPRAKCQPAAARLSPKSRRPATFGLLHPEVRHCKFCNTIPNPAGAARSLELPECSRRPDPSMTGQANAFAYAFTPVPSAHLNLQAASVIHNPHHHVIVRTLPRFTMEVFASLAMLPVNFVCPFLCWKRDQSSTLSKCLLSDGCQTGVTLPLPDKYCTEYQ